MAASRCGIVCTPGLNALDDLPQGDAADGYSPALSTSNFSVEVQSSFDLGWFTFKEFEEQALPG